MSLWNAVFDAVFLLCIKDVSWPILTLQDCCFMASATLTPHRKATCKTTNPHTHVMQAQANTAFTGALRRNGHYLAGC